MELDFEHCYRAVDSRDPRFDGCFYTAVRTTGIYCRPSCPAVTPKRANVTFYVSAAAAQRGGFRACRRCRPDAAPGSPEWDTRADTVGRAMRLIGDGVVDREGVPGLASRLGYTERHLNRMLTTELGAGPLALARAQRAQTARILVETTDLGLSEIAFAAGFGSVRQFNDTMLEVYARSPSQMREKRPAGPIEAGVVNLRLAFRPPLHASSLLGFFAARTLPGVDTVVDGAYRRGLNLPHGTADVSLSPGDRWIHATLRLSDVRDLAPAVARCRRLFDLDADPVAVDALLGADPALTAAVAAEPGVRVPRAVDGFEMAIRAIVGQQVSVAGARTTLGRILKAAAGNTLAPEQGTAGHLIGSPSLDTTNGRPGTVPGAAPTALPTDLPSSPRTGAGTDLAGFPSADVVAGLPDSAFGMPAARRATIRALAEAVADGKLDLDPGADRAETVARLVELPGVGPWTAGYVAMRAIGDPDTFLATDLAARRGAEALGLPGTAKALATHAEQWRPWRSYALIRLWRAA
ncbi:DNA-3-methyladenine glycosylase 2 family protein [Actinoplanes couchii]|uniref:DNA-3-methyladenine glycosylase II n=1 Tax=Actinoplanes couchii TaxID=403638 RepID=A0ABQ3X6H8_9ACTN|nr:AlkA N-terminal domain-containing protein [Actinoplanes couchii]MDR6325182.1 AraC family transcriptional regulator of adaptative response / DNA-3-methyladenine glycosylase II [Actinoplanes couchii]GID54111.1 DNA-3-methyladenine glycosylase [Actinoplanes couchii]